MQISLGTKKPAAATSAEWGVWEKEAGRNRVRYWLAEEGLDYFQKFLYLPYTHYQNICHYVNNRWVHKTHALTSNLKRGQWHEFEERILHSAFDELVNFVEIDQAWMEIICTGEERRFKLPWYRSFFRAGWRSHEAGISHLKWAAELRYDDNQIDKNDPLFGQLTQQALVAQETLSLYHWWKEIRPKRVDPDVASGWSDYCAEKSKAAEARGLNSWWRDFDEENETESTKKHQILDSCHQMEKEHEEEDTAMLIRLVKIRQGLWT